MASNGYPHMVFVEPDAGLDKESLAVFLEGLFPDADVTDKPLRVDLELGGYVFSFWLEEAEGVADRYATYLPEGARRRWLSRCESMIDLHGQPDPERRHAASAQRIVAALQEQDGIEVFSEETRRFVGMDYADRTSTAPAAPTVPAQPAPAPLPGSDSVPAPADIAAAEFAPQSPEPPESTEPATVWMPAAMAQPAPYDVPAATAQPAPYAVPAATAQPAPYEVPAEPAQPAPSGFGDVSSPDEAPQGGEQGLTPEKKRFFKRVFRRRAD